MDMRLSPEDLAFRDEVRALIQATFPPEKPYAERGGAPRRWHDALLSRGWAAWRLPTTFGGAGWTPTQMYVWERETTAAGLPSQVGGAGMGMLAPILIAHGSREQQARFLPDIVNGRTEWCQGYSEPGAGSDLASLRTRAVRDGEDYIVDGEKIWTSGAHKADWIFCLTRTSSEGPRQAGITFLLFDMATPGVEVFPLVSIDGQHSFNRLTFTNVRVPVANRVGDENQGWAVAKGLLTHERTGQAYVSLSMKLLGGIREAARQTPWEDRWLIDDPRFSSRLAMAEIELKALEVTELRTLWTVAAGSAPGDESSLLKLRGAQVVQQMTELYLECAGPYAAPWEPRALHENIGVAAIGPEYAQRESTRYFQGRGASIAGGSDEIQRNIIAKQVLRL